MIPCSLDQKVHPWRDLWPPAENSKSKSQEVSQFILKRHSQPNKDFLILSAAGISNDWKGRSQAEKCLGILEDANSL